MDDIYNLKGKKILLTGASDGIGKATSIFLSQLGAQLVLISRTESKLHDVYMLLEGEGHFFFPYDLTNIEGINDLVQKAVERIGPFDGFVHCAGVGGMRPLKMVTPNYLHGMMLLNFYSFIEIVRRISKKENHQQGLSIVAMSSIAAKQGQKSQVAYCASKAALDGAIRALAKELADKRVRINSIVAGMIQTGMYERFKDRTGQSIEDEYLLGLGEPIDIAHSIAFLLSPVSRIITGTGLVIDSGKTA